MTALATASRPRPQTAAERMRRYRARRKAALAADRAIRERNRTGAWPKDAAGLCSFIETLTIPTGPLAGNPIKVLDFQREFLEAILADYRSVTLSVSRRSGKSMLISALLLGGLLGVWHNKKRWRALAVSLSGRHVVELRSMIEQLASTDSAMAAKIRVLKSPQPGFILGVNGSRVDFLASDSSTTGHSLGVDMCVVDELGKLKLANREMISSVTTALGSHDGVFVAISIRGAGKPDFPFMDEREEAAQRRPDRHWFKEYAADPGCDLHDRDQWFKANPGLGFTKSLRFMEDAADEAVNNEADFRVQNLNQRVQAETRAVVPLSAWRQCVKESAGPPTGDCALAIDMGSTVSMCCISIMSIETGDLFVRGAFNGTPNLRQRGKADGVGEYWRECWEAKELRLYDGPVPIDTFLADVLGELGELAEPEGYRIVAAGADRYKKFDVAAALAAKLDCPVEWRGAGAGPHGGFDVRSFVNQVMGETIQINPRWARLLTYAVGASEVRRDSNANESLERGRANARIDALASTVIVAGLTARLRQAGDAASADDIMEMKIGPSYR